MAAACEHEMSYALYSTPRRRRGADDYLTIGNACHRLHHHRLKRFISDQS